MIWYMLPSMIALAIKLWLLITIKSKPWAGKRWITFVTIFAVHNFSELLVFTHRLHQVSENFIVRNYHFCTLLVLIYGLIYVIDEKKYKWQRVLSIFFIFIGSALALSLFVSDALIVGYTYEKFTLTSIKGNAYWLFQTFAMLCSSCVLVVLFFNLQRAENQDKEIELFYTTVALVPLAILTIVIVALMMLGFNIHALVFIPIASTLFLVITLKGKNSSLIMNDWRYFIPFSLERRLNRTLHLAAAQYLAENADHQHTITMVEKALLEYKRDKHKGNISKASESMGMVRSTYYSKMNRLDGDKK